MTESIYKVLTPAGAFEVAFGDDDAPITDYRGESAAIQFFKDWLLLNQISGDDGWRLSADSLEPGDLYGFCQPPGSGITVLPPFEDLISYVLDDQPDQQEPEDMTTAILDAATGREALQLAKELKQIRAGMAELTGRAALAAVKRIRDIRQAFGVTAAKPIDQLASARERLNSEEFKKLIKTFAHDLGTIKGIDDGTILGYTRSLFVNSVTGKLTRMAGKDPELVGMVLAWIYTAQKDWKKPAIANKNGVWSAVDDWTEYLPLFEKAEAAAAPAVNSDPEQPKPAATIADVNAVMPLIKQFIGKSQLSAMGAGVRGEEGQFFKDKFIEVARVIESMPKTYDTDGQGDKAIAYLHYFKGNMDWYITEKDAGDVEDEKEGISGQIQAFGYADFGHGGELGYISIKELIESGVELDLYWSPKSIGAIKGKDEAVKPEKVGLSPVQKMTDAVVSHGGEVVKAMDYAVAFALHGGKYYGDEPPLLSESEGMYRVGFHENGNFVSTIYRADPFEAVGDYVEIYEKNKGNSMPDQGQNPIKAAFVAELAGLKLVTDIDAFNTTLDDIADRVDKAGLMEELDAELNAAADVLTELLAKAENS